MKEPKIICPYCEKEFSIEMKNDLYVSEGSYTPDCVGSKIVSKIEIFCGNCKKLVYVKEIVKDDEYLDNYDELRWS